MLLLRRFRGEPPSILPLLRGIRSSSPQSSLAQLDAIPRSRRHPRDPRPTAPNCICCSSCAKCVGGTQFADAASPSTFWYFTGGPGYVSAYGYIPDGARNDSTATNVAATGGRVSTVIATPIVADGDRRGRGRNRIDHPKVTGIKPFYTPLSVDMGSFFVRKCKDAGSGFSAG